jgi:hypothetical protein
MAVLYGEMGGICGMWGRDEGHMRSWDLEKGRNHFGDVDFGGSLKQRGTNV